MEQMQKIGRGPVNCNAFFKSPCLHWEIFAMCEGPGCAIVATYAASTLLHGLSAQLAAVLLSLGLYTWVEHNIRYEQGAVILIYCNSF
jgi:hypothetical protein